MSKKDAPKLDDGGQFDRSVGSALSWWNHVEDHLGDVFCALFGSINNTAARGAYLAVMNFNARLQMTDAAARASGLPEDLLAEWRRLRSRSDKKSSIRNKLTHFSRIRAKTPTGEPAIFLLPNFWTGEEWTKALNGRGTRWTWPEVMGFGQDFGKLAIELNQLARKIEAHKQAHPLEFPLSTHDPFHDSDIPNDQ